MKAKGTERTSYTAAATSAASAPGAVFRRGLTAPVHVAEKLSFSTLHLDIFPVGEDIAAILYGGNRPHVGCTVIAVPRPSLRGDGSISCTSSVINLTGHKDEQICRYAAEALCRKYQAVVTCTGGFHVDGISSGQIEELMGKLEEIFS